MKRTILFLTFVVMSVLISASIGAISSPTLSVSQATHNSPVIINAGIPDDTQKVILEVFDDSDVLIATLHDGRLTPGTATFSWNPGSATGEVDIRLTVVKQTVSVGGGVVVTRIIYLK